MMKLKISFRDFTEYLIERVLGQETCRCNQVPLIFRENYIHSGYRPPDKSWTYYLASLFHVHNESINVWSHLVALVIFVTRAIQIGNEVDYTEDPLAWALLGFAIGTISYALCSTFAHLFQSKSRIMHYTCFQIDYIGIGMNGYGNACLLYYLTGTEVYYRIFSSFFMTLNVLFAVMVCISFGIAKLRYSRPYPIQRKLWQLVSCSIHVVFGGIPLLFKIYDCVMVNYNGCSARAILRHLEYIFWFAVSSFFFASGIPERLAPGKFDILGHGHQFFHVIMTYTSLLQYQTAIIELKSRPRDLVAMAAPNAHTILGGMLFILSVDILFITCTHRHRLAKVMEDSVNEEELLTCQKQKRDEVLHAKSE